MTDFFDTLQPYIDVLPEVAVASLIAFLITPFVGKFARKFGFVDLPKDKRSRNDKTRSRRIHKGIIPKLGALSIIISFIVTLLIFDGVPTEVYPIILGMILMTIMGIIDDKYDLSGKSQILVQLIAVLIVVISGTTIQDIQIAGQFVDFSIYQTTLDFGVFVYNFVFPADLITIAWIMIVMNALAWVCGIDALGESITLIASITFGALSIKFGNPAYALMFFIFAGSIYGFIPYNFPQAKIFAGAGAMNFGFFLASMAVISGTKLPSAIMILTLPIIDMIWVIINRLKNNKLSNPLELLSISDKTHLHHRIMDLGFNKKETLWLELVLFSIFCVIAFYFGGFSTDFIFLTSSIVLVLLLFSIIGLLYKANWRKKEKERQDQPQQPIDTELSPEQRYAY